MNQEPSVPTAALRRYLDPNYKILCSTLAEVGSNIDQLDMQMVALQAERGRDVKEAARFKRDAFQVSAPQRQQEVIDKVVQSARQHDTYPEVMERLD